MQQKRKNILIAVDGSNNSLEAVRYVGRLMPDKQTRVTLFNVFDDLPESCLDLDVKGEHPGQGANLADLVLQRKQFFQDFTKRAQRLLSDMGYESENILVVIKKRDVGVARDIADEARKNYDALVLGRKGMGELRDLICGSVANKLLSHLQQVPIWVVGNRPDPSRVIVAMDRSTGARRALEYAGDVFADKHPDLLLLHVTRSLNLFQNAEEGATKKEKEDWLHMVKEELAAAEKSMELHFRDCIGALEGKGADLSRVRTKIIPGVYSRAGTIYGEATAGGYGTIVLGRRGLSRVEELMMGRVSSKVLQLAQEMAVWIVQ